MQYEFLYYTIVWIIRYNENIILLFYNVILLNIKQKKHLYLYFLNFKSDQFIILLNS